MAAYRGGEGADAVSRQYPKSPADGAVGMAISEHRVLTFSDVLNDATAPRGLHAHGRQVGNFSLTVAPMVCEGRGIGAITLGGAALTRPTEHELALLKTFADQAVIAIQNARLFNETKEALDQQTATAEVLQVISASVADTQPVFDKILRSCERLFAGDEVGILLAGDDGMLHLGAQGGANPYVGMRDRFPAPLEGSATALAISERRVLHYADVLGDPAVPPVLRRLALGRGFDYSLAMAPMLWEGRGVGSMFVTHAPPSAFSAKDLELLKTFADQAVIAIENVRLFNEIQDKSRQLEIANKHKSRVPRQHEPRAAHAAERDHRLLRSAARADVRRAERQAGGLHRRTSSRRASTCSRSSTTSSTCRRSRPGAWSWTWRPSTCRRRCPTR